jgi:tetratricopeptide (TPR) repeat protein
MSDSPERGPRDGDRRPGTGRPTGGPSGSSRPYKGKPPASGRPSRDGQPPSRDGEKRLWTKGGTPARGDRDARERETPEDRDPFGTRSVRSRHDDPIIPEDVQAKELDRIALNELKTLSKENAEGVAQHLVMAARLIESDPQLAHQHAISAARRAGRIGVVRETLAITAYATGDYALALRELRTYRRITGRNDQLPMMVDSERGLGRPEKALEEGRSVTRSTLPVPVQVELAIAMSGARLDLGQKDAALEELRIPQLDPNTAFEYSPALFDAYAAVLEELGRDAEAEEWYERSERASEALDQAENGGAGDVIEIVEMIEESTGDNDVETGDEALDE